ncbi:MAG: ATPase [Muribaculaceae bacterium]|nr:ATPase [Muribaculaceae bacterium]
MESGKGRLIVDSGSTKTLWSLLPLDGKNLIRVETPGLNPLHSSEQQMLATILKAKEDLGFPLVKEIKLFGAGCANSEINKAVEGLLKDTFQASEVSVESDMVGAALALFGDGSGVAAILGTGSNTCLFSQGKIINQIPSLGFILGDEGSGVALGKALLNNIFKRNLPSSILADFQKDYNLPLSLLIKKVYQESKPAPFIASFAPFLKKHIENPDVKVLVEKEFDKFFIRNVIPYGPDACKDVRILGSVAINFSNILKISAEKHGIKVNSILKDPMPSLELYYFGDFISQESTN